MVVFAAQWCAALAVQLPCLQASLPTRYFNWALLALHPSWQALHSQAAKRWHASRDCPPFLPCMSHVLKRSCVSSTPVLSSLLHVAQPVVPGAFAAGIGSAMITEVDPTGSLVLALGGFSVDAETGQSELPGVTETLMVGSGARQREVAAGTKALVAHACSVVSRVVEGWKTMDAEALQHSCETLASLCFAMQSAVGPNTSLADGEERQLFKAASALWVRPAAFTSTFKQPRLPQVYHCYMQDASLRALSDGAEEASTHLDRMGCDVFAIVDGEKDATQDCASYVTYFCSAASSWTAAGQRDRARACLDRAMRYSRQLESLVACREMPLEGKEGYVVALFNLYLEGAKSAADNKQQVDCGHVTGAASLADLCDACSHFPCTLGAGSGQQPTEPCSAAVKACSRGV
jgi:hypothetical protein